MLSILVVDDEAPVREWIVYCIKNLGQEFNVVGTAKSGKEAYNMILDKKPNAVITDIKMPGMDGIELMQQVKKILPYTKFIILTNYAEFSYAKEAITYGATEYLLKSELRSADLAKILEEILKEQTEVLEGKKSEILSNRYIDLYSLYQNYDSEDYCVSFWKKFGMDGNKPYAIVGVYEDISFNQRQIIVDIALQLSPYYINVAFRHQIIYIVLQERSHEKLQRTITEFINIYFNIIRQDSAVSEIQSNLKTFMEAINQAQTALASFFFKAEKSVSYYDKLTQIKKLDYGQIRKGYEKILSLVSLKQYKETIEAINIWFDNFNKVNANDITWAREMCIKLVISLEEKLYQLEYDDEFRGTEIRKINSSKVCKETCIEMIEKMLAEKDEVKSKSISEALNYIHKNYNKDISLIKVANHVYRSPEYFSRLFKDEVGENFSVYLMMYRLNYADKLLKTTNMQISRIANEVGYATPSYFSRIYKKYMGMSPEEARSKNSDKMSK